MRDVSNNRPIHLFSVPKGTQSHHDDSRHPGPQRHRRRGAHGCPADHAGRAERRAPDGDRHVLGRVPADHGGPGDELDDARVHAHDLLRGLRDRPGPGWRYLGPDRAPPPHHRGRHHRPRRLHDLRVHTQHLGAPRGPSLPGPRRRRRLLGGPRDPRRRRTRQDAGSRHESPPGDRRLRSDARPGPRRLHHHARDVEGRLLGARRLHAAHGGPRVVRRARVPARGAPATPVVFRGSSTASSRSCASAPSWASC